MFRGVYGREKILFAISIFSQLDIPQKCILEMDSSIDIILTLILIVEKLDLPKINKNCLTKICISLAHHSIMKIKDSLLILNDNTNNVLKVFI